MAKAKRKSVEEFKYVTTQVRKGEYTYSKFANRPLTVNIISERQEMIDAIEEICGAENFKDMSWDNIPNKSVTVLYDAIISAENYIDNDKIDDGQADPGKGGLPSKGAEQQQQQQQQGG